MKVLQLIDSLEVGGAERIAVTYANALAYNIDSFLCVTRKEGPLLNTLNDKVGYLFLNKKSTIDFKAIFRLRTFIKSNEINIIHAHSTSYFLASLLKISCSSVQVIWHNHNGASESLSGKQLNMLKLCSGLFNCVISVNNRLLKWGQTTLNSKMHIYIPNFVSPKQDYKKETTLQGVEGKRIICLANLRDLKDHGNLLRAFIKVYDSHKDWTLHLVGKTFNDSYLAFVRELIVKNQLENNVFVYGVKTDIDNILSQSNIGVLSSKSEGLPVALLEYGMAGLPVVVTNVGECASVVKNKKTGIIVPPQDSESLSKAILFYINDNETAKQMAINFKKSINIQYTEQVVLNEVLNLYKSI